MFVRGRNPQCAHRAVPTVIRTHCHPLRMCAGTGLLPQQQPRTDLRSTTQPPRGDSRLRQTTDKRADVQLEPLARSLQDRGEAVLAHMYIIRQFSLPVLEAAYLNLLRCCSRGTHIILFI